MVEAMSETQQINQQARQATEAAETGGVSQQRDGVLLGSVAATFMLLFSLAGIIASAELLWSEMELLSDPNATLICDVNVLIGCSDSLLSWQAHLLTLPNALFGLILFAAIATIAVVQLARAPLPRWMWQGLIVGTIVGLALVGFFIAQSVGQFKVVCPFCMMVWAATLGLTVLTWLGGLQHAKSPKLAATGNTLMGLSWAIILCLYLVVVLVVAIVLRDQLAFTFG